MTFLINLATLPFGRDSRSEALDVWRTAERVVVDRWHDYTTARRSEGEAAFIAYLAALDAEQAAANDLQALSVGKA